jgi:hypothetical protein
MIMVAFYGRPKVCATPTVETRRFSFPKCPIRPRIIETREKPAKKILDLTRPVPTLSFMHREQVAPSEETSDDRSYPDDD